MKLEIKTDSLQKKLPFLTHAISSRSQLPILLNILIEAKGGKLTLSATDLEIGIQTTLDAAIEEEGVVTVPAKLFLELIAALSAPSITIITAENSLVIQTKKTKNVLPTIPADEFPMLYENKGKKAAVVSKETLQKDFAKVFFAASIDSGRPALSGIYLKKEEEGILLVATDGYRLSLKHYVTQKDVDLDSEKPLIIPARVFKEAAAIREDDEEIEVFVSVEKNQIAFTQGETTLIGRLIDAQFPPYERIIPTETATTTVFDREELLKAVKICAIFARDSANIIKLALQKDKIIVSTNASTAAENTVAVEATLSGEENEIAFNAKYLLDVLSIIDKNEMLFEMTGPLNPGVFKIVGDSSFLHLIMPIRVQG